MNHLTILKVDQYCAIERLFKVEYASDEQEII